MRCRYPSLAGSCFKLVRVGDLLPSGDAGSVSGLVFLLDHTTLYIRDFQFQVQGTGQFSSTKLKATVYVLRAREAIHWKSRSKGERAVVCNMHMPDTGGYCICTTAQARPQMST